MIPHTGTLVVEAVPYARMASLLEGHLMESTPHTRVAYYLPTFGEVGATLHTESSDLYRSMARQEVDRLKRMPQLGIVPQAWEGARHTRWEYIVLTLMLIDRARHIDSVKLRSNVRLVDGSSISGSELLNCWNLLLNIGHLDWTFTAEKALLYEISELPARKRDQVRTELLQRISHDSARSWAEGVLLQERVYQFHQVLAFYRLRKLPATRRQRRLWAEILATYVSRDDERASIATLRDLFKRIRRIAFLTLDAEYTPSVLHVSLGKMLNDSQALGRLLDEHARVDELASLETYLDRHIYSGSEVLLATAQRNDGLRELIGRELRRDSLAAAIEPLALGHPQRAAKIDGTLTTVLRIELDTMWLRPPFTRGIPRLGRPRLLERAAERWATRHGARVRVTVQENAAQTSLVLAAYADAADQQSCVAAVALAVRYGRAMRGHVRDNAIRHPLPVAFDQQFIGSRYAQGIIDAALAQFFSPDLRWEWDRPVGAFRASLGSNSVRTGVVDWIEGNEALPLARLHELRATVDASATLRSSLYATSISNLKAYRPNVRTPDIEVDGVAVSVDLQRRHLVLTVVEAKLQHSGGESAARNDLKSKFVRLGLAPGVTAGRIRTRRSGQRRAMAWRHLRLPYEDRT